MTIADVREAAAQLLEKGWTQGYFARDASGEKCNPNDPAAVCWCMAGALVRSAAGDERLLSDACEQVYAELRRSFAEFNDRRCRTQAEVVAAMRGQPKAEA
jgi:hypothetical protein